jgi:hypothetical protein
MRSGTMWKISLTRLEQLPVIDPATLSEATVRDLAAAFDTLRDTPRHSDSHNDVIADLDQIVYRALDEVRPE